MPERVTPSNDADATSNGARPHLSHVRIDWLLENLPAAAYACDAEGLLTYFNAHAVQLWGRRPQLNNAADRFCGSFKIHALDCTPKPLDQCAMAVALQTGSSQQAEVVIERPDGSRAVVLANINPVYDAAGAMLGAVNVLVDITERKLAEERLRDSEERLRKSQQQLQRLFNASPLPAVLYGLADGRIVDVNERFLEVFASSRDEVIGQTGLELGLWCNAAQRDELVARVRQEGVVRDFEVCLRARDGRQIDMVLSAQVIELFSGPAAIVQANDVTERKQMEHVLRDREERFRALVEHGFEGINIVDGNGRITFASVGNPKVLEYPPEEVRERSVFEMIHPDDALEAKRVWTGLLQNPERPFTPRLRFRHRDGSWRWMDVSARNLLHHPAVRGIVVNWRDITVQMLAEERLRASEERLRLVIEQAPAMVWTLDKNLQITLSEGKGLAHLGLKPGQLVGLSLNDYLQTDDPQHPLQIKHRQAIAGQSVEYVLEWAGRLLECRLEPMRDAAGNSIGCLGVGVDVTERHEAERSLRASEERYRLIAELSSSFAYQATVSHDQQVAYQWVGGRFHEVTGYHPEELTGLGWLTLVPAEDLPAVAEHLAGLKSPQSQPSMDLELRIRNRCGDIRWVRSVVHPVLPSQPGEPMTLYGAVLDITDRKRAQETIRQIQEAVSPTTGQAFFRTLVNYLSNTCQVEYALAAAIDADDPNIVHTIALSHRGETISNISYNLRGTPCENVIRHSLCYYPTAIQQDFPEDTMLVELGIDSYMGIPLKSASGKALGLVVLLHTRTMPDPDQARAVLQVVATRCAAELERQKGESALTLFRALVDRTNDSIEVIDPHTGRFLDVNEKACLSHGYTREEYLRLTVADVDPLVASMTWAHVSQEVLFKGSLVLESHHRRKDGTLFPVEVNCTHARLDRDYFLAVVRDITERKRAEEALRESRDRLRLAVEASNLGTWDWNLRTNDVVYSSQWKRQLGYEDHEIAGDLEEWDRRLHVEDRQRVLTDVQNYLDGRQENYSNEFRLRHKDGSYRWMYTQGEALRDADGQPYRMLGCHIDITDRKRAEQSLRASEARLSAVIANSPGVAVQFYDRNGRVMLWNKASEETFQLSEEEALGKTLDQLIHTPEEFQTFLEVLDAIAQTGQPVGPTEYAFRRGSGEQGVCLSTLFAIPGRDDESWFVCMDVDITHQKRAEEERRALEIQILRSQKLDSLGVMAGGIAHDFNNLLTVVLGYTRLALKQLPDASPAVAMLQETQKAAEQAADLTRQMLAYSGKGAIVVQTLRLDELVRELAGLLQIVVSKQADVRLKLEPATIEGDATQIRQVVMNLITNASDALEGRTGKVQVRTGVRQATTAELRSPFIPDALPAGSYAFLEVEDNGCGMTEESLSKIFDPFYTTKFTGRGLGLPAVLGIVRGHRGTIKITSTPQRGSVFQVFLPMP